MFKLEITDDRGLATQGWVAGPHLYSVLWRGWLFERGLGVFRIEISDDRAPERRRPDPVVAQAGVFAELAPEELSAVERARPEAAQAAAAKRAERPARYWLAEDVLKYLTRLYARFSNPFRKKMGDRK